LWLSLPRGTIPRNLVVSSMNTQPRFARMALWCALIATSVATGGCFRGEREQAQIDACKRLGLSRCEEIPGQIRQQEASGVDRLLREALKARAAKIESTVTAYNVAIEPFVKSQLTVDVLRVSYLGGIFGERFYFGMPDRLDQTHGYATDVPIWKMEYGRIKIRSDLTARGDFSAAREFCDTRLARTCSVTVVVQADVVRDVESRVWAGWVDIVDYSINRIDASRFTKLMAEETRVEFYRLMHNSPDSVEKETLLSIVDQKLANWARRLVSVD